MTWIIVILAYALFTIICFLPDIISKISEKKNEKKFDEDYEKQMDDICSMDDNF